MGGLLTIPNWVGLWHCPLGPGPPQAVSRTMPVIAENGRDSWSHISVCLSDCLSACMPVSMYVRVSPTDLQKSMNIHLKLHKYALIYAYINKLIN